MGLAKKFSTPSNFRPRGEGPANGPPLDGSQLVVYPMWDKKPSTAVDFFESDININVGAGAQDLAIAGTLVTWGQGVRAVLSYLRFVINSPSITMDIYFTLKHNGAPIAGFTKLRAPSFFGAATLYEDDSVQKRFAQQGRLQLFVTNNSGVAFNINAALAGWTWDMTEGDVLTGGSAYAN